MTVPPRHLLPANATDLERALSMAMARIEALPLEIIAQIHDPMRCPAELLPILAACRSVDLWDERWPAARKRQVILGSYQRHARKGTPAAVEQALADMDVDGARVIERLGSEHAAALRYDGVARHDGAKDHSGRVVAVKRGKGLFGLTIPADAMDRIDEVRRLVAATQRASVHLAWIRPEQRLVDVLPPPTDSHHLLARAAVADQLLPGPRYDGAYAYGGGALPRHDGVIRYDGAVTYDGSPLVTAPAQIHYGRPLMADAVTITVRRAIASPLDAPARHDGGLHYDGAAHHTGRRSALTDATAVTVIATPPEVVDWDDNTGWDDGLRWIDG